MKKKLNLKKIIASITTFAMITTSLVGCGTSTNSNNSTSSTTETTTTTSSSGSSSSNTSLNSDKKEIVCTIFPIYDWLSEIIGDDSNIELKFLMNNGVDLHSYQPSVNDIITIQQSDLFVYVGGTSDSWVDGVLKDDMKTLNLMDLLGDEVVIEEYVEGMQETPHAHDHAEEEAHDHAEEESHDHAEDDHDHAEDDHDHAEDDHDHAEEESHDHAEDDHDHAEDDHDHAEDDHDHADDDHDHADDDHDHAEEDHDHADDDHDHAEEDHDHAEEESHDHAEEESHDHAEDESHDHAEEESHDHDHAEERHYDEHVWLSLDNAKFFVDKLLDEVVALTPENTDFFTTRAEDYINELDVLDDKYESIIDSSSRDIILVADRFPLRYLVDDYDLDYYAAFSGCSAEAEVSFETIKFLTEKVDELALTTILITDGATQDMAQTIINNSSSGNDIDILTFNSMQSITNSDIQMGISYLDIMLDNLEDVLVFALN